MSGKGRNGCAVLRPFRDSAWDWISVLLNCPMDLHWWRYHFFHHLLRSCAGDRVQIRPKRSHSAIRHNTNPVKLIESYVSFYHNEKDTGIPHWRVPWEGTLNKAFFLFSQISQKCIWACRNCVSRHGSCYEERMANHMPSLLVFLFYHTLGDKEPLGT